MRLFYVILCLICCVPLAVADGLPELGDVSATVLSPLQEQRIADQIMRDVYRSSDVIQDPEINDYVQALGNRLAAAGPDKAQKFNFFVVKDRTINAFAMPGGVIGVHTGLITAANSESEVAGVLGHEIGHVVQHHLARMLANQKRDTIINMATMALALLAARGNPQLGSGALVAASAGGIQKQLDYTREHEREADRVGMQILGDAGFDTHGMGTFFETLQKGSRFSEGAAPSFLRTHPLTSERISDVKGREAANFKMISYSPDFDYVRAKLVADLGTPSQAVDVFRANLEQRRYNNEAAQHYGLAVASVRNRDFANADKELLWLRTNAPKHAMFASLAANIEVARNRPDQAVKLYISGLQDFPGSRALIYGYAEHFLNLGQADKALKLVADKQSLYPEDPYFYEMSAKAYAMQGKLLLSFQAQGEAYVRKYNLQGAIEQMDLATKAKDGDFYQHSIVEARLKDLKQQIVDPKKI
ncbi:MAG TPA: M48 family metalloprotease [Methylophilaceae bacterium]|nr:M48 family metalloprotease [Methylophilaceae bacterium]